MTENTVEYLEGIIDAQQKLIAGLENELKVTRDLASGFRNLYVSIKRANPFAVDGHPKEFETLPWEEN